LKRRQMMKSAVLAWGSLVCDPRNLGALTPLIWEHVNPYGRFEPDMEARLPID
jgi:hypothetical protein